MKKKKRILIDFDDVIFDTLGYWVKSLNYIYGLNVDINNITDWDLHKAFPTLTNEQMYSPLTMGGVFWSNVKPKEDAIEVIKKLYDEGNDIYVVTASDYRYITPKFRYTLERYFPFINKEHIIISYNKSMIDGDYLIDDYPNNFENGKYNKLLFDTSYNKDCVDIDVTRVYNWKEIYKIINEDD